MMIVRAAFFLAAFAVAAVDHVRAEIPIGFSTPLTGPHAWVGEPHLAGTELAVADLNAKGGILGEPLEPERQQRIDDQTTVSVRSEPPVRRGRRRVEARVLA